MNDLFTDTLIYVRDSLLLRAPYLAGALHRLSFREDPGAIAPWTDGQAFYIDADALFKGFFDNEKSVQWQMIHVLAHIMLGHLNHSPVNESVFYETACDLCAVRFVREVFPDLIPHEVQTHSGVLEKYFAAINDAGKLAETLASEPEISAHIQLYHDMLQTDDHSRWHEYMPAIRMNNSCTGHIGGIPSRNNSGGDAKRVGTGQTAHELDIALSSGHQVSFEKALRRYACLGENPRPDPETFQIPLYLYSRDTLGACLIEESEYTEEQKLSSFVIAIDTSGSCARGLTQRFLELTRDILLSEHLFFSRFNLHIIQCDNRIHSDDLITSADSFRRYIDDLHVYGGGGTDFRPIFARVDDLISRGRLPGLRGILCFTDGLGIYPTAAPRYGVTFAFPAQDHDLIDVPSWIERIIFE